MEAEGAHAWDRSWDGLKASQCGKPPLVTCQGPWSVLLPSQPGTEAPAHLESSVHLP